jgi:hypothetical protein
MKKAWSKTQGKRLVAGSVSLIIVVAVTVVPTIILAQGPPRPPREVVPQEPPPYPASALDFQKAQEAAERIRTGDVERVDIGNGFTVVGLAGPATRGKTIEVGGRQLKLPDDAFIEHNYAESYLIARGEGRAFVLKRTDEYKIAIGPRSLFQFLSDTLGPEKERPYEFTNK